MKRCIATLLLLLATIGCARHSALQTAEFRSRAYNVDQILLTPKGLSEAEMRAITSTLPPSVYPVDVALIVIRDQYVTDELEQLFVSRAVEQMNQSPQIGRVNPIPKFLLPTQLNFSAIQELGIRTLSEYVFVFILDGNSIFKSTKLFESKYEVSSNVEFIVVDAKTTAIMASDRLYSSATYDSKVLKAGEKHKAQVELFGEQGEVLGGVIAEMFTSR